MITVRPHTGQAWPQRTSKLRSAKPTAAEAARTAATEPRKLAGAVGYALAHATAQTDVDDWTVVASRPASVGLNHWQTNDVRGSQTCARDQTE